jgi:hypothetical protein
MEIDKLDINSKEFKKKFKKFISPKYNIKKNRKSLFIVFEDEGICFCAFNRYDETRSTKFDFYKVDSSFKTFKLCYSIELRESDFFISFEKIKKGKILSCFFTKYEPMSSNILGDILFAKKDYLKTLLEVFL